MTRKATVPVEGKHRVGEVAGGTAAECVSVCCCVPLAVVHFVVQAVYTVPKGLLKKAVTKRRKRHRKMNDNTIDGNNKNNNVVSDTEPVEEKESATEAVVLENEMWDRFAGTGFWRTES